MMKKDLKSVATILFTCLFFIEQILAPAAAIAAVPVEYGQNSDYTDTNDIPNEEMNEIIPEENLSEDDANPDTIGDESTTPDENLEKQPNDNLEDKPVTDESGGEIGDEVGGETGDEADSNADGVTDNEAGSSADGVTDNEADSSADGVTDNQVPEIILPEGQPEIVPPVEAILNALPVPKAIHLNHDGIIFDTALTANGAAETKITADGNYYLDSDIYLPTKGIVIDGNITVNLCLNGHSITSLNPSNGLISSSFSSDGLIVLKNGATLNIYDCYDEGTHDAAACKHNFGDTRDSRETVTVYGGLIGATSKAALYIGKNCTVHMYAGMVAGCDIMANGAINVQSQGSVILEQDVEVCYNRARSGNCGGVFINKNGDGIINGAIVDKNMSMTGGAGIHLNGNATLSINGGRVADNKCITTAANNSKKTAAGIFISGRSNVTLTNAVIRNNVTLVGAGGIYLGSYGKINVSGDTVIDGNIVSDGSLDMDYHMTAPGSDFTGYSSNVVLNGGNRMATLDAMIIVTGRLTLAAQIGITSTSDDEKLTDHSLIVAKADAGYNGGKLPNSDFERLYSDDENRSLVWNSDNQVEISTGRVHAICGLVCDHLVDGEPIHEQTTYQSSSAGYAGGSPESGSYYIDDNMELTQPIVIKTGRTVNLCFNGHEVKNTTGPVFIIEDGAVLNLCDCYNDRQHEGTENEYIHTYRNPGSKVERTVVGGLAVGYFWLGRESGGVKVNGGEFNLFSGTLAGAAKHSGVEVSNGGSFTMWGGAVNDNYKAGNGGGVYVEKNSTFDLRGGNIMFNRATEDGGGVYAEEGFDISGKVNIMGNVTNIFDNNVFIPVGVLLNVTGNVTGHVGVKMERLQGIFTTGGKAAGSVDSFKADASEGTYVDVLGKELCLTGYGIRHQPTSESRAVVMRSPENVISYQWYETEEKPLTAADVISSQCTYNAASGLWQYVFPPLGEGEAALKSLECLTVSLHKGDTLRLKPQNDMQGVALLRQVTTDEGQFSETVAYNETPAADGSFYIAAPSEGDYILAVIPQTDGTPNSGWQSGSLFATEISIFNCGNAIAHQTGPGYTGADNTMVICEARYVGGVVVVYSEPIVAGSHEHLACGEEKCQHNPKHTDIIKFTPLASNLDGELLAGENVVKNGVLRNGNYAVISDMQLPKSITIDGDVTICLNGKEIIAEQGYAVKLNPGATLTLCDCTDTYGGLRSNAGGGLYLPDNATAIIYAADISGSRSESQDGGIYVSPDARLEVSDKVRVRDNRVLAGSNDTGEETDCNVYLAGGAKVILFDGTSDYTEIGITVEDLNGTFTEGAKGISAVQRFFSDMPGKFIRVVNGELAFMSPFIVLQPVPKRPTVVVNNNEGVAYQWYLAESTAVTNHTVIGNSGRYEIDSGTWSPNSAGLCFTVQMDAGEILKLAPAENWTEDTGITLTADSLSDPLLLAPSDDMFQWTATEQTNVTITMTYPDGLTAPSLFAEIYQATTPLEEKTSARFSGDAGTYVCKVTYKDGLTLQSNLLVLTKAVSAASAVSISSEWNGNSGSDSNNNSGSGWNPFIDVKEDDWYYNDVKAAYEWGIIEGVTDTLFIPRGEATRAMAVMVLYRMADVDEAYSKTSFVDIDPNAYYYEAVCWADKNNIIEGIDETHFCPNAFVSREQMVTLLYRYAVINDGMKAENWATLNFPDLPAEWAMEAFEWAVENHIVEGKGDGLLDPKDFATRGELVAILNRYRLRDEDEEEED